MGILFGTHRIRIFFIVIPAARLLNHLFSLFQKLDLPCPLTVNGSCNGFKGVEVFHFCTCTELFCTHFPHRKIHVGTHGALLQLTVRCAKILDDQAKLIQIRNDLLRISHIRLRDNLNQRNTASVVVHQGTVFPLVMNQFSCIFLHMDFMDPYHFLPCGSLNLDSPVMANGQVQL